MKTTRLLVGAALLLGACNELWAPFQGPNANFCDPSQPACVLATGDASAVVVDAGVDFAVAADAAVADLTTTADLSGCTPDPASPWVLQATPAGAGSVSLTGVTGNGTGVWVVGGSTYAAYIAGGISNQITGLSGISGITRVAYMPGVGKAVAPGNCLLSECVALMGTSSGSVPGLGLLDTASGGVWADQGAPGTAFVLGASGVMFTSTSGTNWSSGSSSPPASLSALSGPPLGGESPLWGLAGSGKKVAQYTTSWKTASTGTLVFNSLWYGPGNLVWLVGTGGTLRVIPANVAPSGAFTTVATNVTTNLNDVAGTKDGEHVFIVGASGTLLHYESKCQTLTKENDPLPTADVNAVWIDETAKKAWAVGANGTLLTRAIP
jgi:hypothetical protein